jgi:hypothetical protein
VAGTAVTREVSWQTFSMRLVNEIGYAVYTVVFHVNDDAYQVVQAVGRLKMI